MTFATRRPSPEQRAADRSARIAAQRPPPTLHTATMAGVMGAAVPKPEAWRSPALLDMARGRRCLLAVPGICNRDTQTTVAAHSNWSIHGKAGARTADDCYSVWACSACHIPWLDQGKAPAEEKEARFMAAHSRQVMAWRIVAVDPAEPERFRRAARAALEQLGATPLGEAP